MTLQLPNDGLRAAACREADPEIFEVTQPRDALAALAFCARCDVVAACRNALPDRGSGVWGGEVWSEGRSARNTGRPTLRLTDSGLRTELAHRLTLAAQKRAEVRASA